MVSAMICMLLYFIVNGDYFYVTIGLFIVSCVRYLGAKVAITLYEPKWR